MYFKVLELCMKKISLRFYDLFLQSEFILYFPYHVKNMFLITLIAIFILALPSKKFFVLFPNR
jgi:hypothetical protein